MRKEITIKTFKKIGLKIAEIKNEYWKLFAQLSQNRMEITGNLDVYNNEESKLKEEIDDIEQTIKLIDEEDVENLLNKIENEGFNKEMHLPLIENHLKIFRKVKEETNPKIKRVEEKLEILNKEKNEIFNLKEEKDKILSKKLKDTATNLQLLILELNKISLVGISDNGLLKNDLLQLNLSIQEFINEINSRENINKINISNIIKIKSINNTMIILDKIENQILK